MEKNRFLQFSLLIRDGRSRVREIEKIVEVTLMRHG